MHILGSRGREQESGALRELDGQASNVDGLDRLSKACLALRAAPDLANDASMRHDLLSFSVCNRKTRPDGSIVPVQCDERAGVEHESAHAADGPFLRARGCTMFFLSISDWRFSSSSENVSMSAS